MFGGPGIFLRDNNVELFGLQRSEVTRNKREIVLDKVVGGARGGEKVRVVQVGRNSGGGEHNGPARLLLRGRSMMLISYKLLS